MGRCMILSRLEAAGRQSELLAMARERLNRAFDHVEARLGEADYFAGTEFTAADIMMGFSLTTMRYFLPYDYARLPHLRAYLKRIGERPVYRRAMEKGDPVWRCCSTSVAVYGLAWSEPSRRPGGSMGLVEYFSLKTRGLRVPPVCKLRWPHSILVFGGEVGRRALNQTRRTIIPPKRLEKIIMPGELR